MKTATLRSPQTWFLALALAGVLLGAGVPAQAAEEESLAIAKGKDISSAVEQKLNDSSLMNALEFKRLPLLDETRRSATPAVSRQFESVLPQKDSSGNALVYKAMCVSVDELKSIVKHGFDAGTTVANSPEAVPILYQQAEHGGRENFIPVIVQMRASAVPAADARVDPKSITAVAMLNKNGMLTDALRADPGTGATMIGTPLARFGGPPPPEPTLSPIRPDFAAAASGNVASVGVAEPPASVPDYEVRYRAGEDDIVVSPPEEMPAAFEPFVLEGQSEGEDNLAFVNSEGGQITTEAGYNELLTLDSVSTETTTTVALIEDGPLEIKTDADLHPVILTMQTENVFGQDQGGVTSLAKSELVLGRDEETMEPLADLVATSLGFKHDAPDMTTSMDGQQSQSGGDLTPAII